MTKEFIEMLNYLDELRVKYGAESVERCIRIVDRRTIASHTPEGFDFFKRVESQCKMEHWFLNRD